MLGGKSQYAATVTGGFRQHGGPGGVNGVAGGSAAVGSISAKGLYVAPGKVHRSPPNITITGDEPSPLPHRIEESSRSTRNTARPPPSRRP